MIIIQTDADAVSYKNHNRIIRKTISAHRALERSSKWRVIGRSNRGNKILCREFGRGKKRVLIVGGMHGDEPGSTLAVIRLAEYLKKNPGSIENRAVLIPCLNPDGLAGGRRTNGRKVDINRNFPSETWTADYEREHNNPGAGPASEPETVALMDIINEFRPSIIIQVHQPFEVLNPGEKFPAELLMRMSETSGLPVSYDIGYPTPGSLGSYTAGLYYMNCCTLTYELGRVDREPDYKSVIRSLMEAINYPD